MQTLSLREAAALLKTTPETVSAMIRGAGLPAAKVGRAWVLIDIDVIRWLRTRYGIKGETCDFTETHQRSDPGISISASKESDLDTALAPRTGKRRKSTPTASKRDSGANHGSGNVRLLRGMPQS